MADRPQPAPPAYVPTERTRLRRLPERAAYDRATVHAILDEGFICHVGFELLGQPYVVPTGYARVGERLYLHGSSGSRLGLRPDLPVCVTVTLLEGIVLARSAFHHSFNYRSVTVLGRTRAVTDEAEKAAALEAFVDHGVPGRAAQVRGGSAKELAATAVLALPMDEVSAKVRSGGVKDEPDDLGLPYWAGVLPLGHAAGMPEPDEGITGPVPAHVSGWIRPGTVRR
jgi:nitroimidazol reductase NimA-like FMN-containing flavoprotein (pyridoxamine 5'-phosphate oxidase superfamily)